MKPLMKPLNQYIDHTLLKPDATESEITKLCEEAKKYSFFSVCVNSCHVPLTKKMLAGNSVKVCAVVGFPLGAMISSAKAFEAKQAINQGADEIDMVINIGFLKSKNYNAVLHDLNAVREACSGYVLKVILETSELDEKEIVKACELSVEAGADFVKTSTGFGSGGATLTAVKIMKETVQNKAKIKASGGIRDAQTALKFIELGVERLGVSSGVEIMNGLKANSNY